ncbi:MAG: protein BatD [Candidatus Aureabacteria bacterium]|nr:protein BatD [Candidatus Auribacterota bacterium]
MKRIFLFTLLLFVSGSVFAFQMTSKVNSDQVALGEPVYFTVILEGNVEDDPVLPDFSGFYLRGKSIATKLSMGTGKKNVFVKEYMYTLVPEKEGELVIGPVTAEVDGKEIKTDPIKITVKKGLSSQPANIIQVKPSGEKETNAPGTGEHVFVHEYPSKQVAFAGEQIVLVTKFYYDGKIAFDNLRIMPQSSPGFVSEVFADRIQYDEKVGDTIYRVFEIRTAYFPMNTGLQFIQGPKFEFNVYYRRKWIGYETERVVLGGKKNKVDIKPLPEKGRPGDFTGQVGEYAVQASLSKDTATAGEPLTFKFSVVGSGNIAGIKAPVSELEGFNIAGIETETSNVSASDILERQKVFSYIVIPQKPGDFMIPAVKLSYFEPVKSDYKVISSQPLKLKVEKGKDTGPVQLVTISEGQGAMAGEKIIKERSDLPVYRKNVKDGENPVCISPSRTVTFSIYFAGIIIFAAVFVLNVHREKLRNDEFYARKMFSGRKVKALFRQANEFALKNEGKEFSTSLKNAIREFVGGKIHIPAPSVDMDAINLRLGGRLGQNTVEEIKKIFDRCDEITFTSYRPDREEMMEIIKKAKVIINEINRHI